MPQTASTNSNQEAPRTQAERTALAHSSMIEAAIELLNTVGVQGTTLAAIGETAGYSRGLATHHFGSKAGLFREVLKRISAAWNEDLTGKLGGKTGLQAITTAIDSHLAHALRHPEYIRAQNILWGAAMDPSSEFKPNVAEFMRIQRGSVAGWVKGCCEYRGSKGSLQVPSLFFPRIKPVSLSKYSAYRFERSVNRL
jgi:AcrR family transcriptional regulator